MPQRRYELSDEQWEQIQHLCPLQKTGRPSKNDNRTMFNAILWIARSGAAWRDLPIERFGPWKTVYTRFCNWRESGLLVTIFQELTDDADFENISIDSTSAIDLLSQVNIKGSNILADKAYGSTAIREWIVLQEASYTIPPKDNAKEPWEVDWPLYKERHLVECFFNKLKHFRRITTRYDKLASSFLMFVYAASIWRLTY